MTPEEEKILIEAINTIVPVMIEAMIKILPIILFFSILRMIHRFICDTCHSDRKPIKTNKFETDNTETDNDETNNDETNNDETTPDGFW